MGIWEQQKKKTEKAKQLWIEKQEFNFLSSLIHASNEEEVKAAYIREFSLPVNTKERHDLKVKDVLFEFKYSVEFSSHEISAKVIAQAIYYINRLYTKRRINEIRYLVIADKDKARIFRISDFEIFYKSDFFDWKNFRPSSPDPKLIEAIKDSRIIESNKTYRMSLEEELQLFSSVLYNILFSKRLASREDQRRFGDSKIWIWFSITLLGVVLLSVFRYLHIFNEFDNRPVNIERRNED